MVASLAAAGTGITWEQVQALAAGTVGRPHVAQALLDAGAVPSLQAAFTPEWIGTGGRHWAGKRELDVADAVRLVTGAGGVAVFAHPGAAARGRTVPDETYAELAAVGLAGLEVDHADHPPGTRAHLRGLAGELGLLVTGSSDFHGTRKPLALGSETTADEAYEQVLALATGTAGGRREPVLGLLADDLRRGLRHAVRHHGPARVHPAVPRPHRRPHAAHPAPARRPGGARLARRHRLFAVVGQQLLAYLGIGVPALQGAGGLLLLIVALELLTDNGEDPGEVKDVNVALVPLGTPLLAGPGAIVATIVFVQQADGLGDYTAIAAGILAIHLAVYLALRFSVGITQVLREAGILLLTRISGLLLSAIAVQLVADAVRGFVQAP